MVMEVVRVGGHFEGLGRRVEGPGSRLAGDRELRLVGAKKRLLEDLTV
jgi:hypothetical protein